MTEERTVCLGQREKEKRSGRLVGAPETRGDLAKQRRLQQKDLNKLSLPKRKE